MHVGWGFTKNKGEYERLRKMWAGIPPAKNRKLSEGRNYALFSPLWLLVAPDITEGVSPEE